MLRLGDLLEELGLDAATGDGDSTAEVRSVHISELPDPTPWLSGGEVLLTTGLNLTGEAEQREFVGRLADRGVTALGLGTGFDHEAIPAAMVEEAGERDLPLFEVPYEMPFIAITEAAFKHLVAEGYTVLERGLEVHERLEEIVLRGQGMPALLEAIGDAVGGDAVLIDSGGEVTTTAKRKRVVGAKPLVALGEEIASRAAADRTAPLVPEEGPLAERAIAVPIRSPAGSPPTVWLAVIPTDKRIGELERMIARHGAVVVALELGRDRAVRETERRLAGDVLAEALGGRLEPDELLARLRPFNLQGEIIVCVFEHPSPELAETQLADWLAATGRAALLAVSNAAGRPLLCAVIDPAGSEPVELAGAARDELARTAPEVRAAVSRAVAVTSVRRAFHEARCALEATGFADGEAPPVASHEDLGAFTLLLSLQDEEALRAYSDGLLAPIADADEGYGPELLRSLEAFIEQNGHWEKAAKQLYCHRHTLRYRIRKIEELTGRSLASAHDRIELWLALRARELVR